MDRELVIKIKTWEEKDEVLKYLESKGELINWGFGVNSNWCYIAFNSSWGKWSLTDLENPHYKGNKHISKYDFYNNQLPHYEVY